MQKILIYGNGKIADIIYHYLKNEFDIIAFCVEEKYKKSDKFSDDLPLVAFENVELEYSVNDYKMLIAVGYVDMNLVRERIYIEAKKKGYRFVNYIHKSVTIGDKVVLGENNIVLDNVSFQPHSKIGNGNIIWSNVVIAHGVNIGDLNWITSGVVVGGDAKIGSKCFLGLNSTISHNCNIADENFIGANTLVIKDTKSKEVYISREGERFRLDSKRFLQFTGV